MRYGFSASGGQYDGIPKASGGVAARISAPFRWRRADAPAKTEVTAALLLMFATRHYAYYSVPEAWQGQFFNAAGALCIVVLVAMLKPWLPLALWIGAEEAQVAGCSVWAIVEPVAASSEQCSEQVGFKIGSVGLVVLALLAYRVTLSTFAGSSESEPVKK